jgi:ectoine hydroxylase
MKLSAEQVGRYEQDGFLLIPDYFSSAEVELLRAELPALFGMESPAMVREAGTNVVRGVHGVHRTNPVFGALVRQARLVEPARQLLEDDVYVHQFKINAKLALVGEVWEWHQDFKFWHEEDGMEVPRALSCAIFLDEVDEFNGPLMLVPGSHLDGMATTLQRPDAEGWAPTLAAKLKYELTAETLTEAIGSRGIVAPKGPAGSVLLFHCNVLHGSAPNMSPRDRRIVLISYNAVSNALPEVAEPRPEFLAARDFTPLDSEVEAAMLKA